MRISEHLEKKPSQLSGGQKQRVAIGRAITRSPDVFLFDEPLSNLDAALRSQMRVELGRLHAELGATMVYVTHDQTEAMTMADRIVVLNDGIIEQIGSPLELYNRPINKFVAGFLGTPRMNFISAKVASMSSSIAQVEIVGIDTPMPLELGNIGSLPKAGDTLILGIRPEGFGADQHSKWLLNAKVVVIENLGRETLLYLDAGELRTFDSESNEGYFAVHSSRQVAARHGETLPISIDPASVFVFNANGTTQRFGLVSGAEEIPKT